MATAFFGSRRPKVIVEVDDLGLIPLGGGQLPVVVLIGTAEGGEPGVPESFISPSLATARARGGDLKTGIEHAYTGGASIVYAVRVNTATKATKTFQDGTPADSLVVSAANWGVRDNAINVKIETGTVAGSKKFTIGSSPSEAVLIKDNLYRNVLSIQYIGAGTAADMTINATSLAVAVTGGGNEDLTAAFASYPTVRDLVAFIDSQAMYTCTLLDPNPDAPTAGTFDFVTAVDILAAPVTATATLDEIVKWLNSGAQALVTGARAVSAALPPANIGTTYLAGGAEGTADAAAWQAAFDALETWTSAAYLVPLTSDATYHGKALTHVVAMSQDGRRPRRAFCGAALGEKTTTLSTYLARAAALNSDRVALVVQGINTTNTAGQVVTRAPYFLAAQVAGMQASLPVGEPLTQKPFATISRLEWVPTRAELEIALAGGLLVVEQDEARGGFRLSRGITTWLANDAYHRVEISTGVALDTIILNIITALDPFLGRKASAEVLPAIGSATVSQLKSEERNGIIVGDATHPAFRDVSATLQGDAVFVSFQCSPVVPLNFIHVRLHAQPFTGTIAIAIGV